MKRVGRCLVVSITASMAAWAGCHAPLETAGQALIGSGSDAGAILDAIISPGSDALVGSDAGFDAGFGSDAGSGSDAGLDGGSGSDAGVIPDALVVPDAGVITDALVIPDAGVVVPDAGVVVPDAGSGSGSDAGVAGDGGAPSDAGVPGGDAGGAPIDARGGGNAGPLGEAEDLDRTSFYACAGTVSGTGVGLPILAAVWIALRRRRRSA